MKTRTHQHLGDIHKMLIVVWLHAMVCTSSVDASIAAWILTIGRRRVRRKMAAAMLLAAILLWVEKCFALSITV